MQFLYYIPQNTIQHRKIPKYSKINATILLYLIFFRRPWGGGVHFLNCDEDIWQIYMIQCQICINKFRTRSPNPFFFIFMKFSGKIAKIILDPPLTSVTRKRNRLYHISTFMMKVSGHPKSWTVLCSKLIYLQFIRPDLFLEFFSPGNREKWEHNLSFKFLVQFLSFSCSFRQKSC